MIDQNFRFLGVREPRPGKMGESVYKVKDDFFQTEFYIHCRLTTPTKEKSIFGLEDPKTLQRSPVTGLVIVDPRCLLQGPLELF